MKQTEQVALSRALNTLLIILCINITCLANPAKQAGIKGVVKHESQPIPYAVIVINNTSMGAVANASGEFELNELPIGQFTIKAQSMGYKPAEQTIILKAGKTETLEFVLEEDVFGLEQVVVTASRNEQSRKTASNIVNRLSAESISKVQPIVVSDALSYVPGLRTETNCQNCGMVQVRMNGLEGHYSQILINSRPIFSGLVSVYGLELIPTAMIDRVEVTRGGGSALYGSNAIAGSINIITREPIKNSYAAELQTAAIGIGLNGADASPETAAKFDVSVVSDNKKTGMALFGSLREREPFDANGDDFSELMQLKNLSVGTRLFHRPSYRSKVVIDFFRINEERRGGNAFNSLFHEADLTEGVQHKINSGAINYDYFLGQNSHLSVFASAQDVARSSYYGADQSLSDYGQTDGFTYSIGSQIASDFGKNTLLAGVEVLGDELKDQKLGYPDYEQPIYDDTNTFIGFEHAPNTTVANQDKLIYGVFAQYERQISAVKLSAGLRYDYYNITDNVHGTGDCSGKVISPRVNLLWDILPNLQARTSYSQGYRAPQIFDEDLHISASATRQVIHKNADDLQEETSHSYMASLDFNQKSGAFNISLLAEGFYTYLDNAFVPIPSEVVDGTVTYLRTNAEDGAFVQGVNLEGKLSYLNKVNLDAGFTIQRSKYKTPQELGTTDFLRTPDNYGFFTLSWTCTPQLSLITSGQYTGHMPISYYDQSISDENYEGELRRTQAFFDVGLKAAYQATIYYLPVEFFGGVKNLFNSFQDDFETGVERDPTYIYGPSLPRTIYAGIRIAGII
ncbi:TonB-dependent receptor [Carboxylicivirga mesophila]|uniref:TonB-dependent receptor n=1 Tax=Carboxylicivirga mesophila TaxID=1166478 RepID=A0ABS5KFW0_9BACT|nr:TonB-dependent receptor [Carboxylicivirga mesophila]MBS2213896.1 TonB-dependent receptor [Carboxylicivirga mesophila]